MIAYQPINTHDVLAIPAGWDCFRFQGWLYRRHLKGGIETFYREKWLG